MIGFLNCKAGFPWHMILCVKDPELPRELFRISLTWETLKVQEQNRRRKTLWPNSLLLQMPKCRKKIAGLTFGLGDQNLNQNLRQRDRMILRIQ